MTLTAVRNVNSGRFMSPTSSNSADAGIPRTGIRSRIYAKNVLVGDRMLMRGEKPARVLNVTHAYDESRGDVNVIVFQKADGTVMSRIYGFWERVSVKETPKTRRERRSASRHEFWDRYPNVVA